MSRATELIDELRGRVAASSARPDVVAMAPGLAARIRFRCESESFDVVLANERADVQSSKNPASIEISASPNAWLAALATPPEPGFQSFTAWQIKNPAFTVSGDAITISTVGLVRHVEADALIDERAAIDVLGMSHDDPCVRVRVASTLRVDDEVLREQRTHFLGQRIGHLRRVADRLYG